MGHQHLKTGRRRPEHLCVPKTSSVLIARPNRLNVSGDDRDLLAPPGPVRLTVQVKERTCGRERCAPISIGAQGHHDRPSRDSRTLASSRLPSVLAVGNPLSWRPTPDRWGTSCPGPPADGPETRIGAPAPSARAAPPPLRGPPIHPSSAK